MNSAKDLGRIIGKLAQDQQTLQENVYPDDPSAQLQLIQSESIAWSGTLVLTKKSYSATSFVLDHPVYCDIDSATLEIDGGYQSSYLVYPVTYPGTYIITEEVISSTEL